MARPVYHKLLKFTAFALAGLLAVLLLGFGIIYFQAQAFLNKNLSELVSKKSKGLYELSFNDLQISFRHWGMEINNVALYPSETALSTLKKDDLQKQLYTFHSPKVRFSGFKVLRLLLHDQLEIAEILVNSPELKIHGQNGEVSDLPNDHQNFIFELKPLVTKSFRSIKIDKIEITEASFDFYKLFGDTKKLANAEKITIGVLKFYTDSILLQNPERIFETEDIYLKMNNYRNLLGDSLHSVQADMVTYSLRKTQIEVENFELKPLPASKLNKSRYQIHIPYSRIISRHISEFYRNNAIRIDTMMLADAKIKYWPATISQADEHAQIDFDLYELIRDEFPAVSISTFDLLNARLEIYNTAETPAIQQKLNKINIKLEDYLVDPVSLHDTSRIFYAKNIAFTASDYELILGDNIHHIKAGRFDLSTKNRSVQINDIQLFPVTAASHLPELPEMILGSCDSVRLDLFQFKKAFHQARFVFNRIDIFNPEVKITQHEKAEKKVTDENPSFIYKLISNYVKGIYASQVLIEHGKLQLENKTGELQKGNIESDVKLLLVGFSLDEQSAVKTDRLFFANQIELNFSNYKMQLVDHLHRLTIDRLDISTRNNKARMKNFHLFPISVQNPKANLQQYNRSELYEFTIPELNLINADFHEAFFHKKFTVDSVRFTEPTIYFENFAELKPEKPKAGFEDLFELLSNYLDNIHFRNLLIPNGKIRLINHNRQGKTISLNNNFSLALENTLINEQQFGQKKLLFSEEVEFLVHDHLIHLSDNIHVIKAKEIGFSTKRREIFATNSRIYPETNSKGFPSVIWNVQLQIPEIRIQDIDMEKLYFDKKIEAGVLRIKSPEIRLYQKHKNTEAKEFKEFNFLLPKQIESLSIKQFSLNNGSLKVFSEMGVKPYLLVQSDLNMSAKAVLLENSKVSGKPEFIQGEYTADMLQFKFTPRLKNQVFSFDEVRFSTANRSIQAKQLLVRPKTKDSREDQYVLRIPTLTMNGFDMDKAYRFDQFVFESISLEKPEFQYFNNTKKPIQKDRFNPFNINLYPHFESFADVFAAKSIRVNEAEISVIADKKEEIRQKVSLKLMDVNVNKKPSSGFMHAVDFSFSVPGLTKKTELYTFSFGESKYSSPDMRFTVKGIQVKPNFDREKHQRLLGVQSDYLSGKIDSVDIGNPDIRHWFDTEELLAKSMDINGLNLDIFRDKQLPFDESRRPDMLQDMIKSIPVPFRIETVWLKNASVRYAERLLENDDEGKISFSKINVSAHPVTNLKSGKGTIPDLELAGTAFIMDSCKLDIRLNFLMSHPKNQFTATGTLSPFQIPILNPILEPLSSVSVKSGQLDQFRFSFTADNQLANGELYFGYNDLKISVLDRKNGNVRDAWMASFIANNLMLKSKNPRNRELLPEPIQFRRDEKRSIIHYCWKSVFSGIRNTLGIKEGKPEENE